MNIIKKGDFVVRKSYGKDVIFIVKNIIETKEGKMAILRGIVERVEADSKIEDLEKISNKIVKKCNLQLDNKLNIRANKINKESCKDNNRTEFIVREKKIREKIITGKVLHLDGDRRYSEKSYRYYKKVGINAVVKNIPEYRQPKLVYELLKIYKPDILVITGHDGMIKHGKNYNDIDNYRNSKHFIETVKEARRYDKENGENLVIFARSMSKLF